MFPPFSFNEISKRGVATLQRFHFFANADDQAEKTAGSEPAGIASRRAYIHQMVEGVRYLLSLVKERTAVDKTEAEISQAVL